MHGNTAHPHIDAAHSRQGAGAQSGPRPTAAKRVPAIDHAEAKRVLANATGISAERIFARTRIEDLIGDSLVMEVVVCEIEEFLGIEADRAALWKLETVEDLAGHMLEMKALAKI